MSVRAVGLTHGMFPRPWLGRQRPPRSEAQDLCPHHGLLLAILVPISDSILKITYEIKIDVSKYIKSLTVISLRKDKINIIYEIRRLCT